MIGPSFDDVHRDLTAENPKYEALYRETLFEDELALSLAEMRHERSLSQRQLAETLSMQQPMIARIEKGAQIPTATTLFKLAVALHARIEITPEGAQVTPFVQQFEEDAITPFANFDASAPFSSAELNSANIWRLLELGYGANTPPASAALNVFGTPLEQQEHDWLTGSLYQAVFANQESLNVSTETRRLVPRLSESAA